MWLITKLIRKALLARPDFWLRFGIQITPDHYYYPIPSKNDLTPDLFSKIYQCEGIDWNIEEQRRHLNSVFTEYIDELDQSLNIKMMSMVDAVIYYAMIRHYKPYKIIEIGGGESTRIAALACIKNFKDGSVNNLVCIEPYPSHDLIKGFDGLTRLIKEKIQNVDKDEFKDCDMLFIDSSHVVKMGSDVVYEILEILPILKRGCLIHWHDIFIPQEYPEDWVKQRLFWSEQYIVQAFLMYNYEFEIIWASHFMHIISKKDIEIVFKEFARSSYPLSSLWARRIKIK